jgi:uncharacterized protein
MVIGVLQLGMVIGVVGDAMSLKDKRRVIKSLKDRLMPGRNISVAEVGALDEHRRSDLGRGHGGQRQRLRGRRPEQAGRFCEDVPQVAWIDYQIDLL